MSGLSTIGNIPLAKNYFPHNIPQHKCATQRCPIYIIQLGTSISYNRNKQSRLINIIIRTAPHQLWKVD